MSDLRDKIARAMIAETILKALVFTSENSKAWADGLARDIAAVLDLDTVRAEAQVEVLRELAAGFVAPVLRLTESAPIPLHAVAGRLRDRADRIAREAGIETGEEQ